MTKKLSSGRARIKRSTAALGIAGLALAGLAGPALADGDEETSSPDAVVEESAEDDSSDADADSDEGSADDAEASSDDAAASEEGDDEAAAEVSPADTVVDPAETLTIDLVGVNDFHGRIDAGLKVEGGTIVTEGAAVRLAAAVEAARDANPNTFFVGAGDLYSASTFTSMAGDDVPTTDVFNAIGMDASAVGNHEFDHGFQNLKDRLLGNGDYAGHAISWEYLGANVYEEGTTNAVLPEYLIVEDAASKVKIAFIGLVTQETPSLVTPAGIAGLAFGELTEAVNRVAAYPDVAAADAIVVLAHDGGVNGDAVTDTSTHFGAFAKAMADRGDVAGIFSGHTHTKYEVQLDVPTTEAVIDEMPVIQTGSFGDNLGQISITFEIDDDGNATLINSESDMIALSGVTVPDGNSVVDDVRDIVMDAVENADTIGSEIIGEAGADLLRARHVDPQTGNPGENRGGESTISNLIADAQLWAVHEQGATADLPVIAFMNPGGVRTDIPAGEVTYKQVADVQPFANTLETLDLTGAQIKEVLEQQWQPDGSSRPFLKLGISEGFHYTYDPTAPRGERVTEMTLNGGDIQDGQVYRVVTNNFLASGGDNFFALGQGANYADTGLVDLTAFVDYFKAHDVVYPDYNKRALGVHWVSPEDAVYQPGDNVEIDVSSLRFSNGEPGVEELSVSLSDVDGSNETAVGSFAVDATVVNTTDETGRATILFDVPEIDGLPASADNGFWLLNIYNEQGATIHSVPIYVEAAAGSAELTEAWIVDITRDHCTVTISVEGNAPGDVKLLVWDDGEIIDELTTTLGEDGTGTFTWLITRPAGDSVPGVGFELYLGDGSFADVVDPWEYPAEVADNCADEAGDGDGDGSDTDGDGDGSDTDGGGDLPDTGADISGLIAVGALLMVAGAATIAVRRRVTS